MNQSIKPTKIFPSCSDPSDNVGQLWTNWTKVNNSHWDESLNVSYRLVNPGENNTVDEVVSHGLFIDHRFILIFMADIKEASQATISNDIAAWMRAEERSATAMRLNPCGDLRMVHLGKDRPGMWRWIEFRASCSSSDPGRSILILADGRHRADVNIRWSLISQLF